MALKLFTAGNVGHNTLSSKRITFTDADNSFDVGDSLKEVASLEEFKTAFRAMRVARHFALPWDFSLVAVEGFLFNSNFGATELQHSANRTQTLTAFVNYILGLNAQRWTRKMAFLDTGEIENLWPSFYRTRAPAAAVQPAVTPQTIQQQPAQAPVQFAAPRWRPKAPRQLPSQNAASPKPPVPGGLAAKALMNLTTGSAYQQGNPICRRYNYVNCPNADAACFSPSGVKLWHVCNLCHAAHPRKGNH